MLYEPMIEACCDQCGDTEMFNLATTARGYDERALVSAMEQRRWHTVGGEHFCPDCAKDRGLR